MAAAKAASVHGRHVNTPIKYLITFLILALATGLQILLRPVLGESPFILFYPAVILAALYGDGISAICLSVVIVQYFFLPPQNSFSFTWPQDMVKQTIFVLSAFMIRQITVSLSLALKKSQEAEGRLRSVLHNALDAVVGMSSDGLITQWNPQADAFFGYSREEAVGRRLSETIIPPRFREAHENGMKHYLATGQGPVLNRRIEIAALHRDGHELPVELTITPIRSGKTLSFAAFIRDITERKKAEDSLKEAVRARDEFIGICSHELKTPITSMKLQFQMASQMILKGDRRVFSEEKVRSRVINASRQMERMSRLIEDMLDVSRINAGKLELVFEEHDLGALIHEVADRFSEQFSVTDTEISLSLEPGLIVSGDHYRLEQVFSNLFTNALKYGDAKPVTVTLKKANGRALAQVADQGPGISEENAERIFQRFERVGASPQIGGLGMGLYISRQIVTAHHGRIWAEGAGGRGSSFFVELPLAHAQ